MNHKLLIAGATSNSGKTILTMGLLRALCERGLKVQPFKCGPDYIDPMFHHIAAGCESVNLDGFMAGRMGVRRHFEDYARDCDVALVEGVMGLFDGYDRWHGSSAEVAQWVDAPMVMVVDAQSVAYSVAPLIYGFRQFWPQDATVGGRPRLAGVIFNKVASERHYAFLQASCRDAGVECLGYVGRCSELVVPGRHLGLTVETTAEVERIVAAAAREVTAHVDVDRLLELTRGVAPQSPLGGFEAEAIPPFLRPACGRRILVARDEAFNFVYRTNIDVLEALGEVGYFSPLHDHTLPPCDYLYLPGGYPELWAHDLAANVGMRQSIARFAEAGGHVYAECGGFMYLCAEIDGQPMCGVFPMNATMEGARLHLGYRQTEMDGVRLRGHEFHYSTVGDEALPDDIEVVRQQRSATGVAVGTAIYRRGHVVAGYTHWSFEIKACDDETSAQNLTAAVGTDERTTSRRLRPLMLVGTGSDVGKSVIATGLCRIFLQDGYHPAPFKAQNMALNSYVTPDGGELGRAQAVQAEACRIAPHTDMNPLLLKPNSAHTTQVVLNGRPIGNRSAYEYFRREGRERFRTAVHEAFDRLSGRYNPIVMEGAGSVSEINLRESDLVNMPMARYADADVVLVADIDRGGVFASCYGSVMLQTPADRARIKGIIINKFRGDIRLFDEGRRMIEDLCGVPVLGVVPMYKGIAIDEEDSVALEGKRRTSDESRGRVNVAVVLLRHISNFTDFNTLERDERVNLYYAATAADLDGADIIIVPGTKATLDDLCHLRKTGMAKAIVKAHHDGKTIVGICGGYQMLGQTIADPDGVEGEVATLPGLGLLSIDTTMAPDKTTRQVEFLFDGHRCTGYEIHQGRSTTSQQILREGNCIGTYIHGFLDNAPVVDALLRPFAQSATATAAESEPIEDFRDRQYDLLADHLRRYVDIDALYRIIGA